MNSECEINWIDLGLITEPEEERDGFFCPFKYAGKHKDPMCVGDKCMAWIKPRWDEPTMDSDYFGICGMLPVYQGIMVEK